MKAALTFAWIAFFWAACGSGNGSGGGEGSTPFACSYTSHSSFSCGGEHSSTHDTRCTPVSAKEQCDEITKGVTDCSTGCCSSSWYTEVSFASGPCPGSEDASTGADASTGSDAASCPASSGDSACTGCLKRACCAELSACAANADCRAYSSCIAACQTASCPSSCASQHPEGKSVYGPYGECGSAQCATSCQ